MKRKGYLYLGIIAVLIVVLGKFTWDAWFGYVVPTVGRISGLSLSMLLAFAGLAGFASFFAPCAFPLLPGYVSYYMGVVEGSGKGGRSPFYLGAIGGLGIVSFFSVIGLSIGLLGAPIAPYLTKFKPFIALAIALLGVALIKGYTLESDYLDRVRLRIVQGSAREGSPPKRIFLFGVAYGTASLGCTLPVFAALMLYSLSLGSVVQGVAVFLTYSLAMGAAMFLATLLIARTEKTFIRKLSTSTAAIKKGSGVVLVLVGLYLSYFFVRYGM
jgi:cytochrome c-type biogenesis protein